VHLPHACARYAITVLRKNSAAIPWSSQQVAPTHAAAVQSAQDPLLESYGARLTTAHLQSEKVHRSRCGEGGADL
jgi:hypothetical protein